ncbi:hypothetical protein D3C85_1355500 [compost metagenome]
MRFCFLRKEIQSYKQSIAHATNMEITNKILLCIDIICYIILKSRISVNQGIIGTLQVHNVLKVTIRFTSVIIDSCVGCPLLIDTVCHISTQVGTGIYKRHIIVGVRLVKVKL